MSPSRIKYLKAWSSVGRILGKDLRYDPIGGMSPGGGDKGWTLRFQKSTSFQLALSASWMLPQDVTSGLQLQHYACLAAAMFLAMIVID